MERNRTMKAPVGLLSDRTVLRSKMEGLCPDKFQFDEEVLYMKKSISRIIGVIMLIVAKMPSEEAITDF